MQPEDQEIQEIAAGDLARESSGSQWTCEGDVGEQCEREREPEGGAVRRMREGGAVAADLIVGNKQTKKTMAGQFLSSHQRFFNYLCITSKEKHF